jgi:hypothetical protein
MAIFNQPSAPKRDIPAPPEPIKPAETALKREPDSNEFSPVSAAPISRATPAPAERSEGKESLIASDLTIEGKIEGRVASRATCTCKVISPSKWAPSSMAACARARSS